MNELDFAGPIMHPAQCGTRGFASFSLMQFSFSRLVPRCLKSKCICAHLCTHGHAGLKRCVQAHCWCISILRNWKYFSIAHKHAKYKQLKDYSVKEYYFIIIYCTLCPKTHQLIIKRIGTTLLDHAPGVPTIFTVAILPKVDSETQ